MKKLIERRKFATILFFVVILVTTTVAQGVYNFGVKEGHIEVDGKKIEVKTNSKTVKELLKENSIKLSSKDKVSQGLDSEVKENFEIEVRRAIQVVVTMSGKSEKIETSGETVKEVLESENIYYDKQDKIVPALDSKVVPHIEIKIARMTETMKKEEVNIDFGYEEKENSSMIEGESKVIQEGELGLKEVNTKEIYEDGVLTFKEITSEKVIKEPVVKIVEKGTKSAAIGTRGSSTRSVSGGGITVEATAYDDNPANNGGYVGLTAMGTKLRPGVIAVDPRVIPLGTKVYITYPDGTPWGYGIAEDTGGAIKGNKIDIFMSSDLTWSFGRRQMKLYIV